MKEAGRKGGKGGNDVDEVTVAAGLHEGGQLLRANPLVREQLEHFLCALAHVPAPGEHRHERAERRRQPGRTRRDLPDAR